MMYSITLTDGASYGVQWCGVSSGILTIQLISDASIQALFSAFSDPQLTQAIEYVYGNETTTYNGFTDLIMIQDQRWQDGNVMIQLRKGDGQNG